jgi:initiation factor 1A
MTDKLITEKEFYEMFINDNHEYAYARVVRLLGGGRYQLSFIDGSSRKGLMRALLRRRCLLNTGDIVQVRLRAYEGDKADIVRKCTTNEAQMFGFK